MFPWLESFLLFSTIEHLWLRYLDFRQIRRLKQRVLPCQLKDSVSNEEFNKSVDYSLDKLNFSLIQELFSFVVNLIFYAFFFLPYLWNTVITFNRRILGTDNEYVDALIYTGIQIPINKVLSLPFELYFDFIIEARHGFNKKTLKLFIIDEIKTFLLGVLIGSPILCIIIYVIRFGGRIFYIWLWIVSMILTLIMMTIYPNFIAPLFNKFESLADQELKTKIEDLAKSINYPLQKIYQVDESKRSAHSNAYLYGFGKNKRIVLFDTLLDISHDRILAIVGHELGHWRLGHTIKNMVLSFAQMFVIFFLFGFVLYSDHEIYESFGFTNDQDHRSIIIGLVLFSNILSPISMLISIAMTCWSRRCEFQADRFAATLGMARPLQEGLLEIQRKNLSSFTVDPLFAWVHYSHPHLIERLETLRSFEKEEKKEK